MIISLCIICWTSSNYYDTALIFSDVSHKKPQNYCLTQAENETKYTINLDKFLVKTIKIYLYIYNDIVNKILLMPLNFMKCKIHKCAENSVKITCKRNPPFLSFASIFFSINHLGHDSTLFEFGGREKNSNIIFFFEYKKVGNFYRLKAFAIKITNTLTFTVIRKSLINIFK